MKTVTKRVKLILSLCMCGCMICAQNTTKILITGIEGEQKSETISRNISNLLTAFNIAEYENSTPNMTNVVITDATKETINKLWENCPFVCMDNQIVEKAILQPSKEYQVRKIYLIMKPIDGISKDISWKKYQEAVITIDENGCITNFHLAIDEEIYISVLSSAKEVTDLERRMLILEYVERFRNAYNLKDKEFLTQIYSDDALIITGRVIKLAKSDIAVSPSNNERIEYSRKGKKQYLNDLFDIFDRNAKIEVNFDEIKVVRHPARAEYYGVTLKQSYKSDRYSDIGWLFLLWDFTNPDAPKIHIRTWQPYEFNGEVLKEEDILTLDDFDC